MTMKLEMVLFFNFFIKMRLDFGRLRTTEGDIEDRIEKIARKIYREYERQLYDDIEGKEWGVHEGHFHVLGPIGIAMLDLRIGRKNMEFEFPYLSSDQFNGKYFSNTTIKFSKQNLKVQSLKEDILKILKHYQQ